MHMSNRNRTTLTLDKNVIKRAKELDINISTAAERGIIEYIKEMENIRGECTRSNINNNTNDDRQSNVRNKKKKDKVGRLRFELKSMAPEATRIPSYPTSPINKKLKYKLV